MMKTILKSLGIILIVGFIIFSLIIVIGGRDIAPPEISDLMPQKQTIPDDQNAFAPLNTAADAIELPADMNTVMLYIEGQKIYGSVMEEILLKNSAAIASINEALTRQKCIPPENLDPSAYLPKWYRIGLLLSIKTVHDRQAGPSDQSVLANTKLLQFGNMILKNAQNLVAYNIGGNFFNFGLQQAETLADTEGSNPDQLKALAEGLTTLGSMNEGLQQAYRSKFKEIVSGIDNFRASKKSIEETFSDTQNMPYIVRKSKWFPGYVFQENATKQKLAKLYRDSIQNVEKTYADMNWYDLEHYLGLEGNRFTFFCKPNVVGRLFYAFTTPEIPTQLGFKCQLEGMLGATQLIVALKAFEKENSKLPHRLEDLVPAYLSELPMDPFNGQPWHYVPQKRIFYSVSKDLKDSGGSTAIPEGEIYGEDYPKTWVAMDAVFKI